VAVTSNAAFRPGNGPRALIIGSAIANLSNLLRTRLGADERILRGATARAIPVSPQRGPAMTQRVPDKSLRRDPWWQGPAITAVLPASGWPTLPCMSSSAAVPGAAATLADAVPLAARERRVRAGSARLGRWFGSLPHVITCAVVSLPLALRFRLSCYYCSAAGGARPLAAS
jgi:hypothetical protein